MPRRICGIRGRWVTDLTDFLDEESRMPRPKGKLGGLHWGHELASRFDLSTKIPDPLSSATLAETLWWSLTEVDLDPDAEEIEWWCSI